MTVIWSQTAFPTASGVTRRCYWRSRMLNATEPVYPVDPHADPLVYLYPDHPVDDEDFDDDGLKPSRGIAVAVAMVGPFWAALVWWWC